MRIVYCLILLFPLTFHHAQDLQILEDVAQVLIENGIDMDSDYTIDLLYKLFETPLDINFAGEEEFSNSGLFTPFQVYAIMKYREKYGLFFTLNELVSIPGFKRDYLIKISPFLSCTYQNNSPVNQKKYGMSLTNLSLRLPKTEAYIKNDSVNSYYPGSPFKVSKRFRYTINNEWTIGAMYEKDPGENFSKRLIPEHLVGYLKYDSEKLLKQVILGNYKIHRGMGLVHGLGFSGRNQGIELNGFRQAFAKPFASATEYDYYRGIYSKLGLKNWRIDFFLSQKSEDISFHLFEPETDLFHLIRKTGYHRTSSEQNGRNLAKSFSSGISLNQNLEHWKLGISYSYEQIYLTKVGLDSLGMEDQNHSRRSNLSFSGLGFGPDYELFGEIALDKNFNYALIIGTRYEFNPALSSGLTYRHFQEGYEGQTPGKLGLASIPENENGMNIAFKIIPFHYAVINIHTDLARKISFLEKFSTPAYDNMNLLKFSYRMNESTNVEMKVSSRSKKRALYKSLPRDIHYEVFWQKRYRIQLERTLSSSFSTQGRFEYSVLELDSKKSKGKIFYQQITIKPSRTFRLTYRFLLFESEDWENRMYTYEPGVRYSFYFPAWHGKGSRNLVTASSKLGRKFTIRTKIGLTQYAYRRETGSGKEIRPGNKTWDIEFQIQYDLKSLYNSP